MERNLIIFASGTATDGGTGAENLARRLPGRTIAVISSHREGGVRKRTERLRLPFFYFPGPYTDDGYRELINKVCADTKTECHEPWYALSGWFKKVYGLPPARTFNIHPAPLPQFAGLYGEKLHEAVWDARVSGNLRKGEVIMHFVTAEVDGGPVFFRFPFSLTDIQNYESYRRSVRILEHAFQPFLTGLIIKGEISWDGIHPESLKIPEYL